MTETPSGSTAAPPPPPPPPPPPGPAPAPQLVRPAHDRVFRGVCSAIGRATGTDPVLWRVLVVVLVLFGGTGIVLYVAAWLLVPEEGAAGSELQRLVRGQGASTGAVLGVVVLVAVVWVVLGFAPGQGLLLVAVVGGLAYLALRGRQQSPAGGGAPWASGPWAGGPAGWGVAEGPVGPPTWAPPVPGAPAPGAPASEAPTWGASAAGAPASEAPLSGAPPTWGPPPTWAAGPPPSPKEPAPPRPRSTLGLITVSAVVLAVGALLLAGRLDVVDLSASAVLAVALLVTAGGLLVGARWGRSRGLIVLAVVLSLGLGATSSFEGRFGTEAGDRTWRVDSSTERALAGGSATLDLTPLAGRERGQLTVQAEVGVGELVVLVPEDLRVELTADVGAGDLRITQPGGQVMQSGIGLEQLERLGPDGRPVVRLSVTVGLGSLEVRRVAS